MFEDRIREAAGLIQASDDLYGIHSAALSNRWTQTLNACDVDGLGRQQAAPRRPSAPEATNASSESIYGKAPDERIRPALCCLFGPASSHRRLQADAGGSGPF